MLSSEKSDANRKHAMKIIDLDDHRLPAYLVCLEEWSDGAREAGDHKKAWYTQMKERGLRVKLALDEHDTVGGMVQYIPIEYSPAEGTGLYFINCIWVHGHKQGIGNMQGKGMGKALLQAAEDDVRSMGAGGIAAWGVIFPMWMRAGWFKRHGYHTVDRTGIQALLWKPFRSDAVPPKWVRQKARPSLEPGKVTVTAFRNGWCTAMNMVFERVKRAALQPECAHCVVFREIDTSNRAEFLRWGVSDAVFIDGKELRMGPPPSYDSIRRRIDRRVKKLRAHA